MVEKLYELHECPQLPSTSIQVFYDKAGCGGFEGSWNLVVRRESTEEDLEENHYLEEVGETIWQTTLQIKHCPYCGKDLYSMFGDKSNFEGQFTHNDFSKW